MYVNGLFYILYKHATGYLKQYFRLKSEVVEDFQGANLKHLKYTF